MKVLVTGAKGFVGRNLCLELGNIRDGKARCYGAVEIDEVFEYDLDSTPQDLDSYCAQADFVFNLAGVNRPKDASEFMQGNFGFASTLLQTLEKHSNNCPVMLSSSQQASLCGRFGDSQYGRSKLAGEKLFLEYGERTGSRVLVYRFPNLFGKWCRPNYNSAVATFCNNIARGLPIQVNDPSVELELLYIDDLVSEMILALKGEEHRCEFDGLEVIPSPQGRYCYCPVSHKVTLGRIVELLQEFTLYPGNLMVPALDDAFTKKLYSTYLSYLPAEKFKYPLTMKCDDRGSFTEIIHSVGAGQFSVNISKPGVTKGQHWHHSKNEKFVVVKGKALIQERSELTGEIVEFEVSGDSIEVVEMIPGCTHNIINLSDTEELVTFMWANEIFDPARPDTYFDPVIK
ncbi:MAG: NAD-dependent epimerase/dehydratase family protein [Bacteroidales bacterium]|nr:NAD-dependent epimerase/dehydratase family protein [Bacteroidales bacterium]